MADHPCAKGLQPFVLAGLLLAGFAMAKAQAKPYSSFNGTSGFSPLRGVTLNSPFTAQGSPNSKTENEEMPPSGFAPERQRTAPYNSERQRTAPSNTQPSYVMPQIRSPAYTPVQRGMYPAFNPALQAPTYMLQTMTTGATATPPRFAPRAARSEDDAYAPLGLRRGAFIVRPSVETGVGFDSNVNSTPANVRSSAYARLKPEIVAESDWSNHALRLYAGLERVDYFSEDIDPRTNLDLDANARIDIRRGTTLDLGLAYARAQDVSALTTSSLPGNAVGQPNVQSFSGTAALSQKIGILRLRLSGSSISRSFGDTDLNNGTSLSNQERDVRDTVVALRGSYEWTRAVQPFIETAYNRHDYEIEQDIGGFDKGSSGIAQRAGFMFDLGPSINGEVAAGIIYQTPFEGSAESYSGVTLDSALNWSPTSLTTLRLGARTAVLDDVLVGAVGGLAHDATLRLEHKLRRNVTLGAGLGLGFDDYEGIERSDTRFTAGVNAEWQLNRYAAVTAKLDHRALYSSLPGEDMQGMLGEVGLKLQY